MLRTVLGTNGPITENKDTHLAISAMFLNGMGTDSMNARIFSDHKYRNFNSTVNLDVAWL
jgi:hypothetical protein